MAETPSLMVPIGTIMPSFTLPKATGEIWSPREICAGTLVLFICNHCPFVLHIAPVLKSIHSICLSNDIQMVCINSNDVTAYPQDSPNNMITTAALYNWSFPYLYDETQETAKSFQARCTPDIFLYDAHNRLFYRGQFDDSRPSSGTADGSDVKLALQSLLQGDPPTTDQKPSVGCNIKWKNEKV